jgi:hypothetical protein
MSLPADQILFFASHKRLSRPVLQHEYNSYYLSDPMIQKAPTEFVD